MVYLNKNTVKLILTGVLIGIIIYAIIKVSIDESNLDKQGKYTVGVTNGHVYLYKSVSLEYYYYVNGNKIISNSGYPDDVVKNGGKYIVRFLPEEPQTARIDLTIQYPDSLPDPPPSGWDEYPLKKFGFEFK